MNKSINRNRTKLIKDKKHDSYQERGKWLEPTICRMCGATYAAGRWSWHKPGKNPHQAMCSACHRTVDHMPAGFVEIRGQFALAHHDEIMNLIRNTEQLEKQRHPMERIMEVEERGDQALVTTTGVHVARRIGEALTRSFAGEYSFQYGTDETMIRVRWRREE